MSCEVVTRRGPMPSVTGALLALLVHLGYISEAAPFEYSGAFSGDPDVWAPMFRLQSRFDEPVAD